MRISDWSSDVCASDLESGNRAVHIDILVKERAPQAAISAARTMRRRGSQRDKAGAGPIVPLRIGGILAKRRSLFGTGTRRARIGGPAACVQAGRSEEHTSELQSLMRISYDVFCLKKKHSQNTEQH